MSGEVDEILFFSFLDLPDIFPQPQSLLQDLIVNDEKDEIVNYFNLKIDEYDLLLGAVHCYNTKNNSLSHLISSASKDTKPFVDFLFNNHIDENVPILYLAHLLKTQDYSTCYEYLSTISTSTAIEYYAKSECCFALEKYSELQALLTIDRSINILFYNGLHQYFTTNSVTIIKDYLAITTPLHLNYNMRIIQNLLYSHDISTFNPLFTCIKHEYVAMQSNYLPVGSKSNLTYNLISVALKSPTFEDIQSACNAILMQLDMSNLVSIYQNEFVFYFICLATKLKNLIYPCPLFHVKYIIPTELDYLHTLLTRFKLYASANTLLIECLFLMGLNIPKTISLISEYDYCIQIASYAINHSNNQFVQRRNEVTSNNLQLSVYPLYAVYLNYGLNHHKLPLIPMQPPTQYRLKVIYSVVLNEQTAINPNTPILINLFISFHFKLPLPTHSVIHQLVDDINELLTHYQHNPTLPTCNLLMDYYLNNNDYTQALDTLIVLNQFDNKNAVNLYDYYINFNCFAQANELYSWLVSNNKATIGATLTDFLININHKNTASIYSALGDYSYFSNFFEESFMILTRFTHCRRNTQFPLLLIKIMESCTLSLEQQARISWLISDSYDKCHMDATYYIKQSVQLHKYEDNCSLYIKLNFISNPVQCQGYLQFLNKEDHIYYKSLLFIQQHMYLDAIKLLKQSGTLRCSKALYQILYRQDMMHLVDISNVKSQYLKALYYYYANEYKIATEILVNCNSIDAKLLMIKMIQDPSMINTLLKQLPNTDEVNYFHFKLNLNSETIMSSILTRIKDTSIYHSVAMSYVYKDTVKQRQVLKKLITMECSVDNFEILEHGLLRLAEIYMNKQDNCTAILNKLIKQNANCYKALELMGDLNNNIEMYMKAFKSKDYNVGIKLANALLKNKEYLNCIRVCDELINSHANTAKIDEIMNKALGNMYK
eukprot:NODE_94_length_21515_cov_0.130417.p2 type:complete len:944 gc:universal NODE_94_length_21515_cov_0.130417:19058-16227(-)